MAWRINIGRRENGGQGEGGSKGSAHTSKRVHTMKNDSYGAVGGKIVLDHFRDDALKVDVTGRGRGPEPGGPAWESLGQMLARAVHTTPVTSLSRSNREYQAATIKLRMITEVSSRLTFTAHQDFLPVLSQVSIDGSSMRPTQP
eukprot:749291-Hanusia_phi.AAC.4